DVGTKDAVHGLSKTGPKRALLDPALQGGIYTHDGGTPPYSPHALAPTLEEKVEPEHQPPTGRADEITNDEIVEGEEQERGGSAPVAIKNENGHLPTDAYLASTTYSQPSQPRMGRMTMMWMNKKPIERATYCESIRIPLCDEFWDDIWVASAVHNTEIFRRVFRVVPDDPRHNMEALQGFRRVYERILKPLEDDLSSEPLGQVPSAARVDCTLDVQVTQQELRGGDASTNFHSLKTHEAHLTNGHARGGTSKGSTEKTNGSTIHDKGKKNRGELPFTKQEREEKEALLEDLCGHLVIYPTRFLESEDVANNFLFNTDRMLPLPIYD
ncbi:hypothetical protein BGY98DRAFT_933934, partial [Russula aff. rugulosa BPL654]